MTANRLMLGIVLMATILLTGTRVLAAKFPATGQTSIIGADKNDGIPGLAYVPEDGTLQRGADLQYMTLPDGMIKDVNTGLIWEVKCAGCGGLHDVNNIYRWSGDGTQETIWDWLEDINMEDGTGYAGHNDWRIPNVRELESLMNYQRSYLSIDPIFDPTVPSAGQAIYWSSTSFYTLSLSHAWCLNFTPGFGLTGAYKDLTLNVRAVRGGRK